MRLIVLAAPVATAGQGAEIRRRAPVASAALFDRPQAVGIQMAAKGDSRAYRRQGVSAERLGAAKPNLGRPPPFSHASPV